MTLLCFYILRIERTLLLCCLCFCGFWLLSLDFGFIDNHFQRHIFPFISRNLGSPDKACWVLVASLWLRLNTTWLLFLWSIIHLPSTCRSDNSLIVIWSSWISRLSAWGFLFFGIVFKEVFGRKNKNNKYSKNTKKLSKFLLHTKSTWLKIPIHYTFTKFSKFLQLPLQITPE